MKRTTITALALLLGAAACGGASSAAPSDDPTTTTSVAPTTTTTTQPEEPVDPDAVVLGVRFEGGFLPVELAYHPSPRFVLYADGRLLFPGPIPEIFPGPQVHPFQVVQLTKAQMADVIAAVETTGLPDLSDERYIAEEGVADAADTVFVYDDGEKHRVAIYALELAGENDPVIAPYVELSRVLDDLAFSGGQPEDFEADRYQVVITSSFGVENEDLATVQPSPLSTPIADIPLGGFGELRCITLSGDEAATAGEVFAAANQMTFFEDGGETYRFTVRPLAPHEEGCPTA